MTAAAALAAPAWRARAHAAVFGAAARALRPDPRRTVDQWADAERVLPPGVSPKPGRWKTETVPYLREPMQVLSLSHPARRVTLLKSAQCGGTEAGVNLLGQIMSETPAPCLVVVPASGTATTYNKDKLVPLIEATPAVRRKVREAVSRDGDGSTAMRKAFEGGFVELAVASASRSLQSKSVRVLILEEISEYPLDLEGRGDPVDQAIARTIAFTGQEKILDCSTPYLKGQCRITALYAQSSRGVCFVPCPHCAHEQPLDFVNLRWPEGKPELAQYHCAGCGAGIRQHEKRDMVAAGVWRHERPDLVTRHAGYKINTLYSPFVPWPELAARYEQAQATPAKQRAFSQQYLGEAYEDRFDLPSEDVLFARREAWPAGRIPPGVLWLTGAVDVQGDRLEWAVWGFDRAFTSWRVDAGVIEGDPTQPAPWVALDALVRRKWRDAFGRELAPEIWGVDSGYLTPRVYAFCAGREMPAPGNPPVIALDGRARWGEPALGMPASKDIDHAGRKIGAVRVWPVGTWDLKLEVAQALRLTELGPTDGVMPPGAVRLSTAMDLERVRQLTAEVCKARESRTGYEVREWVKVRSRNEELDLAVYCRGLARHSAALLTEDHWRALAAARLAPPIGASLEVEGQTDLAELWTPGLRAAAEQAARERDAEAVAAAARAAADEELPAAGPWGSAPGWGAPAAWGA